MTFVKHTLRPDQQRLAREDMGNTAPASYAEWEASENRHLLIQIIHALTANPKLAAEIKILLRGDKP